MSHCLLRSLIGYFSLLFKKSSFQGDTSVVVLFVLCVGVEFLCCLNLMYVFLVLVKFG